MNVELVKLHLYSEHTINVYDKIVSTLAETKKCEIPIFNLNMVI